MRKLQEGDVLKKGDGNSMEVIQVFGKYVLHTIGVGTYVYCAKQKEIEEGYWKLDEPEWKPKVRDKVFVVDLDDEIKYCSYEWDNDEEDKMRLERGLVFKTKEEAIKKANLMLNK